MAVIIDLISKIKKKGVKHFVINTIPWLLYDKFDKLIFEMVKRKYISKPLQNVIIIESHNDFDSNGGAFYDYLIENGYNEQYKIVWFLRNKCPQYLPKNVEGYRYNRLSLRRAYYHCIAKYILCEHYVIPAIRKEQKSVFMRHGAGGLKKATGYIQLPEGIQYILGMSEAYAPIENLRSLFSSNKQKIIYIGFPSHDYLFKDNSNELKKITNKNYKKVILWMPTFRKTVDNRNDSNIKLPLGIPLFQTFEEFESVNMLLEKENCFLIIKIHPMQEPSTVLIHDLSNIKVITGEDVKKIGVDNYKLMSCCDAMISDYSGAAYDFIQLNRPLAYVLSDMNEYKIGFVVDDIHKLIAGKEIYELNDMYSFIHDVSNDNDEFRRKREELRDRFYAYHDGNNSKRLVEFLKL